MSPVSEGCHQSVATMARSATMSRENELRMVSRHINAMFRTTSQGHTVNWHSLCETQRWGTGCFNV